MRAKFSSELDQLINTSNVVINSITLGIDDPNTLKIEIDGNILNFLLHIHTMKFKLLNKVIYRI